MNKDLTQEYIDIIDFFESLELTDEEVVLNQAEKALSAKTFVLSHIRVIKNSHIDNAKPFYKRLLLYKETLDKKE